MKEKYKTPSLINDAELIASIEGNPNHDAFVKLPQEKTN